jgi:ABC-type lipoprotein export system ATPase subunit
MTVTVGSVTTRSCLADSTSFDELRIYMGDRIGTVGRNGSGKTTLLNILSKDIEPDEGFLKHYCDVTYIRQFSDEGISDNPRVLKEFELSEKDSVQNETVVRTISARLWITGDDAHKSVRVLSGGERIRASSAKLSVPKANALLLDEPTNYLDMEYIEVLENVLCDYESTVLNVNRDVVSLDTLHLDLSDPIDLTRVSARINAFRSSYTAKQAVGVARTAEKLAELIGFSENECKMELVAEYLHGLGKLNEEELNIIKSHTFYGYRLRQSIKGFDVINAWAFFHHEKLNG